MAASKSQRWSVPPETDGPQSLNCLWSGPPQKKCGSRVIFISTSQPESKTNPGGRRAGEGHVLRSGLSPEYTCVGRPCYPWMFQFALHILSWFPGFTTEVIVLVAQSCPTVWDSMDCGLPGSSVHRIHQARILEWVASPFSRGSSRPRDWSLVSCSVDGFFTIWATRETPYNWKSIVIPASKTTVLLCDDLL